MSLDDYLVGASELKAARLCNQWMTACSDGEILCCCGLRRALTSAFRCLYCGEFYCVNCAEKHFGQTRKEWIEAKRVEAREQAEARRIARSEAAPEAAVRAGEPHQS